jgi:hypothetical protein
MNSFFIRRVKHHGFLLPIKAVSGDMLDHHLGKLYFNGGTMIPKACRKLISVPCRLGFID